MVLLRVEQDDIERMAEATVLSYGTGAKAKISKFWILLTLSGLIATVGVAADSVATVVGAMIVAPLMTPIMGVALALVLAKRHYLMHSLMTVCAGALLVIAIAYLFSLVEPLELFTESNSQVAGRIHPRLNIASLTLLITMVSLPRIIADILRLISTPDVRLFPDSKNSLERVSH